MPYDAYHCLKLRPGQAAFFATIDHPPMSLLYRELTAELDLRPLLKKLAQ